MSIEAAVKAQFSIIKISVDGNWTLKEFSDFTGAIDKIYKGLEFFSKQINPDQLVRRVYHVDEILDLENLIDLYKFTKKTANDFEVALKSPFAFMPSDQILLVSVNMASPGSIKLFGLGDLLKQIRELIKDLCFRNKYEKLMLDSELEKRRAINRVVIRTADHFIENSSKSGVHPKYYHLLLSNILEQPIETLIEQGKNSKVTAIEIEDSESDTEA